MKVAYSHTERTAHLETLTNATHVGNARRKNSNVRSSRRQHVSPGFLIVGDFPRPLCDFSFRIVPRVCSCVLPAQLVLLVVGCRHQDLLRRRPSLAPRVHHQPLAPFMTIFIFTADQSIITYSISLNTHRPATCALRPIETLIIALPLNTRRPTTCALRPIETLGLSPYPCGAFSLEREERGTSTYRLRSGRIVSVSVSGLV